MFNCLTNLFFNTGDSSKEHENIASDGESEEVVEIYKEPSMYDNLLKTLGSASESLANAYKMRYLDGFNLVSDSPCVYILFFLFFPFF